MLHTLIPPQAILFIICCASILGYIYHVKRRNPRTPFPPGPKPLPIIGNLRDLPTTKPWETYSLWGDKYGDIVHVTNFGAHIVIINSFQAAYDLLECKSTIYSSRPYFTMFHELMDFNGQTAFMPYSNLWRKHRVLYHQQFNNTAVHQFQSMQAMAVQKFLGNVLEYPREFKTHIRHMAATVSLGIAYGYEPQDDKYIHLSERVGGAFSEGVRPGAFLVDTLPILKYVPAWVPGAGFQRFAEDARKAVHDARDIPFRDVKAQVARGDAPVSFVASALSSLGTDDESDDDVDAIKRVASSIFGAGAGTTSSSLHWFILAMVLYPDVKRKAHAEIDAVVGKERLPEFSDRENLPYVDGILKEMFRLFPPLPAALPHLTVKDDVYNGYFIPSGSLVIPNSWKIMRDPKMYPDPEVFRPERHLSDIDGKMHERDPGSTGTFGFGRRVCPGRNLAEGTIWLTIASFLTVFDVTHALDEYGREIDVQYALDALPGTFSDPPPFKCTIKPRSKEAEMLIKLSAQAAM